VVYLYPNIGLVLSLIIFLNTLNPSPLVIPAITYIKKMKEEKGKAYKYWPMKSLKEEEED